MPALKQKRGQKDINTLVNATVQSVLLDKNNTDELLKKLVEDLKEY